MVQQRYILAFMNFLCVGVILAIRTNISLVLTQMVYIPNVNTTTSTNSSLSTEEMICPIEYHENRTVDYSNKTTISLNNGDRYQWSQQLQGIILSSFNWGYILTELPGGILAQKIGGKKILLLSLFLSAIITAFTPLAIEYAGATGLIVARVLFGICQGPTHPSLSMIGAAWYPSEQRGRFYSVIFVGKYAFGGILATYLPSVIMDYTNRWDLIFYYFAIVTAVWCILFALLCYDQPLKHPFISHEEKELLIAKVRHLKKDKSKIPPTPWGAILTNSPVKALIIAAVCNSWGSYVVNIALPKYMNDIIHLSVKKNGLYSLLPKILLIFVSLGAGFVGDWMYEKRRISLTTVRKLFVALASLMPAVFLIGASYAGCDEVLAVVFFVIAVGCHGFDSAGITLNLFDLGPNYVASLNGFVNTLSTVVGILTPYIVSILTPKALLFEWRFVFWITFAFHLTKTIVFTIWGSARVQPWNTPNENKRTDDSTSNEMPLL